MCMWTMSWSKRAIDWIEDGIAYVSVPFTWNLPDAHARCAFLIAEGHQVRIGGPAVDLMPDYVSQWNLDIQLGGHVDALPRHHPWAMVTSRGCIRSCAFCAVPIIEGDLEELPTWAPKPIICDNNLLACSRAHFDKVIRSLKGMKAVDFNSGLDARLLTDYHAQRLAELDCTIRLSWDHIGLESAVMRAIERLEKVGFHERKIRVYVLVGFDDTPEDARYRLETLRKRGVWPWPMRFNPLDTFKRNSYVNEANGWTERELRRLMRYWSRQQFWRPVVYSEFTG